MRYAVYSTAKGTRERKRSKTQPGGRASAHGSVVHRIDAACWTHRAISHSSQCSTTGVTKAVVCVALWLNHWLQGLWVLSSHLSTGFNTRYF